MERISDTIESEEKNALVTILKAFVCIVGYTDFHEAVCTIISRNHAWAAARDVQIIKMRAMIHVF